MISCDFISYVLCDLLLVLNHECPTFSHEYPTLRSAVAHMCRARPNPVEASGHFLLPSYYPPITPHIMHFVTSYVIHEFEEEKKRFWERLPIACISSLLCCIIHAG